MIEELQRTPPLAYRVAETIRNYIVENRLGAGDRIPSEREFADRMGVSRNVIREALRALELSGIIEKYPGKGAFVRSFDPAALARQIGFGLADDQSFVIQLLEARLVLEQAAISLVFRYATEDDLEELDRLVSAMEQREEQGESVLQEDLAFHQVLLRATHNEPLNRFSSIIVEWMEEWAPQLKGSSRRGRKMSDLHRPILVALRQGDLNRARRLIDDHIELSFLSKQDRSVKDSTQATNEEDERHV